MAYAENTSVPVERSKAEIEKLLTRYGATSFLHGWQADRAIVGFVLAGRQVRFVLPLPTEADVARRPARQRETALAQATRARWRAFVLVLKAKLEAVESGITSIEDEFMAQTVLPDGSTVSDFMQPQIVKAYEVGTMPSMLALGSGRS
jgi:hypothetical protein